MSHRKQEDLDKDVLLSDVECAELEFRMELSAAVVRIFSSSHFDYANLARRVGTTEKRIVDIVHGRIQGVTTDLLIRILGAIGYRGHIEVFRAQEYLFPLSA